MLNKNIKKLLSVAIMFTIISIGMAVKVQASSLTQIYSQGISIGLTSMGNINSLDFTLTGNYILQNKSIILNKNSSYKIKLDNSNFSLYENGDFLTQVGENLVLKPLESNTYIKFTKEGYMRQFSGNMTFKINGNYLLPINTLDIDEYLNGVLPFEEGESFPLEALKAQAIAARTYAMANRNNYINYGYNLRDDVYSQVYRGYISSCVKCIQAVKDTKGEIITYQGVPIDALFSSSNGGYTEKAENVWGGNYAYTIDVPDPFDTYEKWGQADNPFNRSNGEIDSLLKSKYPNLNVKKFEKIDIENIKKYPSGRVSELSIIYRDQSDALKTLILTKEKARTFFGTRSSLYNITVSKDLNTQGDIYNFIGSGYGHGVGMSQWGAYARAKSGQDYRTILNFYYRNITIEDLDVNSNLAKFNARIGGQNRYVTSRQIAEKMYDGQVDNVVIATGQDFPDALSGSVLADKLSAPILLVNKSADSAESSEAMEYIAAHLKPQGNIYILGGVGVVSNLFENKFNNMGFSNIIRVYGKNRAETSIAVANKLDLQQGTPLIIATQSDFPDALSMSPIAAENGWPILLSDKNVLSDNIQQYIIKNKPSKIYIVGGVGVISDNVRNKIKDIMKYNDESVARLGGKDRYETSRIINTTFTTNPEELVVATGRDYPDALSGSVYAASKKGVVMLVDSNSLNQATTYIKAVGNISNPKNITVLGLQGAINDNVVSYLTNITK